jgi:predicted SnoaL-like aldol condensation-catalyzing enzyme
MSKQTRETNKKVAESLAGEVFNKGRMVVFDVIFADSHVMHNMPVPDIPGTKEGFRELVFATRQAFPGVQVYTDDMVAQGDFAVFHDHVESNEQGVISWVPPER